MAYEIEYERPRPQSDYLIARGYINQYTFIVPLFDLEPMILSHTTTEFLEKSQKTFDYLVEGEPKGTKGILYYGVKYTVLLPKERPSPEQFIDMVERHVKDRFYTLKYLENKYTLSIQSTKQMIFIDNATLKL